MTELVCFQGVSWLVYNWTQSRNSILADEMGLGKTIQVRHSFVVCGDVSCSLLFYYHNTQSAAFLELLSSKKGIKGPFLLIVPLSTMQNWYRELQTWSHLDVVLYHGSRDDREVRMAYK